MIVPGVGDLPVFPCNGEKHPLVKDWKHWAKPIEPPDHWPLVGVPTGELAGFDVLDVDTEGLAWFDAQALPLTRMHQSQSGGFHLLFRAAPGLRNSADDRIASGIHVRAEKGFAIWWPRQRLPVCGAPVAEWPQGLLTAALRLRQRNPPGESVCGHHVSGSGNGSASGAALAALSKLDVTRYRQHDDWLRLAMSCHAAGVEREAFIDWSTSDPAYADDGDEIAERWESFRADGGITGRALFVEARMVEIDRYLKGRDNTTHNTLPWEVPLGGRTSFQPTRNPKHRVRGLMRMIESAEGVAREQALFNVACVMREMIAEGALRPKVALSLLESACQINRLWRDDRAACRRAIASAFLTVETKLREEQSDGEAA